MFFAFLFSLVKLSFKSLKTDNKKSSYYYMLIIQGIVIILIFQTLFVMGEMYINNNTELMNNINSIYNNLSKDEINNISENNELSNADKIIVQTTINTL